LAIADALFPRTKRAVIAVLFADLRPAVHLRELARQAGVTPAMMAKEMAVWLRAGLVDEQRDGNRRVFQARADSPVFGELASLARKTAGLADVLRQALAGVPGIELAFVFGSMARGTGHAASDVDLWVVGHCDYSALLSACAGATQALARPVNPVLYSTDELAARVAEDNVFVAEVRQRPRIALIGSEDDIASALGQPAKSQPVDGAHRHPG
jgi:predicted nucleotidyltransferase